MLTLSTYGTAGPAALGRGGGWGSPVPGGLPPPQPPRGTRYQDVQVLSPGPSPHLFWEMSFGLLSILTGIHGMERQTCSLVWTIPSSRKSSFSEKSSPCSFSGPGRATASTAPAAATRTTWPYRYATQALRKPCALVLTISAVCG